MSATAEATDLTELFHRAKNALAILGLADQGQWAQDLRLFMKYENDQEMLETYQDFVQDVEKTCGLIERRQLEHERQAAVSGWVGIQGQRQDFTARVQAALTFKPKEGHEDFGDKHLTILHDDDGNVLVYWNTIKLPAATVEDPFAEKRPAEKGERVSFAAMVVEHSEYKGVKQTLLQRVTKAKLL